MLLIRSMCPVTLPHVSVHVSTTCAGWTCPCSGVLTIHIVGLVLSILLMAVFVLFMLRPYIHRLSSETKRIAELLSQVSCYSVGAPT